MVLPLGVPEVGAVLGGLQACVTLCFVAHVFGFFSCNMEDNIAYIPDFKSEKRIALLVSKLAVT